MLPLQLAGLRSAVGSIAADPLSLVLVAIGTLLFTVTFLTMGYLSLGGLVAAIAPE